MAPNFMYGSVGKELLPDKTQYSTWMAGLVKGVPFYGMVACYTCDGNVIDALYETGVLPLQNPPPMGHMIDPSSFVGFMFGRLAKAVQDREPKTDFGLIAEPNQNSNKVFYRAGFNAGFNYQGPVVELEKKPEEMDVQWEPVED